MSGNIKIKAEVLNPDNWDARYIWGFVRTEPYRICSNDDVIAGIVETLIGTERKYLALDATYHPYHLINPKGYFMWELMILGTALKASKTLEAVAGGQQSVIVSAENFGGNQPGQIWPGQRLATAKNPFFLRLVPFVFLYCTFKNPSNKPSANTVESNVRNCFKNADRNATLDPLFQQFIPGQVWTVGTGKFKKDSPFQLEEEIHGFYMTAGLGQDQKIAK